MNEWVRRSIELANRPGYLDKLSEIYVMNINPTRPLSAGIEQRVKNEYDNRDDARLIKILIDNAAVFPVKDSYIGFIRKKPAALNENPNTRARIAQRLYSLGYEKMVQEATRPKETNRQLGAAFKNWLLTMGYRFVEEDEIVHIENEIVLLSGGDKKLKKFASESLNCTMKKGIDIVIKKDVRYIIGEAKFLTTPGGEQDRGFDDATTFVTNTSGNATRIAILDGYIWLKTGSGLFQKITGSGDEINIMSALLLKEFIDSF